jgi:sigma-B regulation protein RsbU (phosphoserine phosphatase)
LGVIYVDNRVQTGIFTSDDMDLLTAIAASAATAIENARLYQVAVEQGRLERELQMARELQTSLLPQSTPHLSGWDFAVYWQPAREVSGDFYDFVTRAPGLNVLIADVSDKGMAAALFMALSRSILRASLSQADIVADGIAQANRLICADSPNSMFVTLFCAQMDADSGVITYVNAGHNLPDLFHAQDEQPQQLARTGMALGIDDSAHFDQHTLDLEADDCLVLYTDGILDALNAHGEEFGKERLRRLCAQHRCESAADIIAAARAELSAFVGGQPLADDCTMVVIKKV